MGRKLRVIYSCMFALLVAAICLTGTAATTFAATPYVHDPMQNPKAAEDIVVNSDAVYGYSPNPDSPRLGYFADYDWTDKEFVEKMRETREEYHASMQELYDMITNMKAEGKDVETIARAVSTRRNEIRLESYKDDPVGLAKLKQSNLETYGDENGGSPDFFYAIYGSWEVVIEKALSTNAGADAVLGLYDKYYDTYMIDDVPASGAASFQYVYECVKNGTYRYVAGASKAKKLSANGWTCKKAFRASAKTGTLVYWIYDKAAKRFRYTTDRYVALAAKKAGKKAGRAFYGSVSSELPVYELCLKEGRTATYRYTMKRSVARALAREGWAYKGVACYSVPKAA